MKKIETGFMLIELLLVLVIIMFIVSKALKVYFMKPAMEKETQKVISEQGIDATSYQSLIDSSKKKLQDIQDRRMKELDSIADE